MVRRAPGGSSPTAARCATASRGRLRWELRLHVARRHAHSRQAGARRLRCLSSAADARRSRHARRLESRACSGADEPADATCGSRHELLLFVPGAPAAKRRAIIAVWDFCRAVDDAVDEIGERDLARPRLTRSQRWRGELAACFERRRALDPAGPRARAAHRADSGLNREPFEALIEGVEMDLGTAAIRDVRRAVSVLHPRRVGGRVDLPRHLRRARRRAARQYAIDLGVALQLTNILRDVAGDLERGRVYIPIEDLRAAGCTRSRSARAAVAARGVTSPAVKALLERQGRRARDYYARAAAALPRRTPAGWSPPRSWRRSIAGCSTRIERRDYDVFAEVVRIPRPRRAAIAAVTWVARRASGPIVALSTAAKRRRSRHEQ